MLFIFDHYSVSETSEKRREINERPFNFRHNSDSKIISKMIENK